MAILMLGTARQGVVSAAHLWAIEVSVSSLTEQSIILIIRFDLLRTQLRCIEPNTAFGPVKPDYLAA